MVRYRPPALLVTLSGFLIPSASSCPFARSAAPADAIAPPDDEIHRSRSLRRRLSDTPEARERVRAIIDDRAEENQRGNNGGAVIGGASVSNYYRLRGYIYMIEYILSSHTPHALMLLARSAHCSSNVPSTRPRSPPAKIRRSTSPTSRAYGVRSSS